MVRPTLLPKRCRSALFSRRKQSCVLGWGWHKMYCLCRRPNILS